MDRGLRSMRGRGNEWESEGVLVLGRLGLILFSPYVTCPAFVAWCIGRGVVLGCLVGLDATCRERCNHWH